MKNTVVKYVTEMRRILNGMPMETISTVIDIMHDARLNGQQIFVMGNGGSASTASHFVCDLAKSTRTPGCPSMRVIGLTDNMAILSAYANDEGYETVFRQQLANFVQPNDVVIGISASGNSENVLNAILLGNEVGARTIAFTGQTGGKLKDLAQISICVPTDNVQQVEDLHVMLEHMITRALMEMGQPMLLTPADLEVIETGSAQSGLADISLDMVQQLSDSLSEDVNMHDLLGRVLQLTLLAVGATSGSVVVLDEHGDIIESALAYAGEIHPTDRQRLKDFVERGLAGWVIENRKAALIPNTLEDPRWVQRGGEGAQTVTSRSALSVPLISHDRVAGVVTISHNEAEHFTMKDLSLLTAITMTISYSVSSHR